MLRHIKFSLRTLVLGALLIASAMLLYQNFAPWKLEKSFSIHNPPAREGIPGRMHSYTTLRFLQNSDAIAYDHAPHDSTLTSDNPFARFNTEFVVYDLKSGKKTLRLSSDAEFSYCATIPQRPLVIIDSSENNTALVDPETGKTLFQFDSHYSSAFQSSDGRIVAVGNNDVTTVIDTEKGKVLWELKEERPWLAVSADGRLATFIRKYSTAVVFDAATGKELNTFPKKESDYHYRFSVISPDSTYLYACDSPLIGCWNLATGEYSFHTADKDAYYSPLPLFAPDSSSVLTFMELPCKILKVPLGGETHTATGEGNTEYDNGLYFPNGQLLLYSSKADIWDSTPKRLCSLAIPEEIVSCAAIAHDGQKLALLGSLGTLTLWCKQRPEQWWGLAWRYEFWITAIFAIGILFSLIKDLRHHRALALQTSAG
jgi:WD40 repeat protein